MKENFSLKNKVILVTGAAGLMGMQHCEAILRYDGIPVLLDKNMDLLDKAKKSLDKKFSPKMKNKERSNLLKGWSKAIKRTLIN